MFIFFEWEETAQCNCKHWNYTCRAMSRINCFVGAIENSTYQNYTSTAKWIAESWALSAEPAINIKEREKKAHTTQVYISFTCFSIHYAKINYYVREPHKISYSTSIEMVHVSANMQFNSIHIQQNVCALCVCEHTCCIRFEMPYKWN